jgi:hypothetical protein
MWSVNESPSFLLCSAILWWLIEKHLVPPRWAETSCWQPASKQKRQFLRGTVRDSGIAASRLLASASHMSSTRAAFKQQWCGLVDAPQLSHRRLHATSTWAASRRFQQQKKGKNCAEAGIEPVSARTPSQPPFPPAPYLYIMPKCASPNCLRYSYCLASPPGSWGDTLNYIHLYILGRSLVTYIALQPAATRRLFLKCSNCCTMLPLNPF